MNWFERMNATVAKRGFATKSAGFFFVRHGETRENLEHICQGQQNVPLNDEGKQQAKNAAAILAELPIHSIASSDLLRVRMTIEPLLAMKSFPLELNSRLRERGFGVHEGSPLPDDLWSSQAERVEPIEDFATRVLDGIEEAATIGNQLVASHSGVLRVLASATNMIIQPWAYTNALPMRFDRDNRGWRAQAYMTNGAFDVSQPLPLGINVHGLGAVSNLSAGKAA